MLDNGNGTVVAASSAPSPSSSSIPDELEDLIAWIRSNGLEPDIRAALYENRGQGMAHLYSFESLDDVHVEGIRESFGAGNYQVRFRRLSGGWLKQPMVRIAGAKKTREWETPPTPAAPAIDSRLEATLASINRTLEQLASKQANPSADLVGLATAMASVQTPLLAALATMKAPAGPDLTGMMELVRTSMELARDGGGGGGGYGDVVNTFGKPLLELLTRATGSAPPALPAGGELRVSSSSSSSSSAPAAGSAPGWYTALAPLLPQLLRLAELHGDADWWAERIVAQAEEPTLVWIGAELERFEEFEAEFYRWVPDAVAHREWFDGFWDALSEQLFDEGDEMGESRAERAAERTKQAHKAAGVTGEPETRSDEKKLASATKAAAKEEGAAIEQAAAAANVGEQTEQPKEARSSSSAPRARVRAATTTKKKKK